MPPSSLHAPPLLGAGGDGELGGCSVVYTVSYVCFRQSQGKSPGIHSRKSYKRFIKKPPAPELKWELFAYFAIMSEMLWAAVRYPYPGLK